MAYLSGQGLFVQSFHITTDTNVNGAFDKDFNEVADLTANRISSLPVGGDSGDNCRHPMSIQQSGDKGYAMDVGIAILPGKTQTLAQVSAYFITVEQFDRNPAML